MAGGMRKVTQGEYLFQEGDSPDAMYVIKAGRFEVIKAKGQSEIKLAELGPGAMVGEMAFFDNKPRSASVRAIKDGEAIVLPYKSLHAQFSQFPEWTKAIMRTVNEHLRKANQRIKELEKASGEDEVLFPPHTINKLISILAFVTYRYGKKLENAYEINSSIIRKYTIQIFQEATHKMTKLTEVLQDLNLMKIENMGDGNQNLTILDLPFLFEFVEWHNKYLFQKEEERFTIQESEIRYINGLLHFAKKLTPNDKGIVKLNLTEVQNESMKELGDLIRVDDVNGLIAKKVISEKQMESDGIFVFMELPVVEKLSPFWTLIYALKKVTR
jgi:CRP-like cAMP-binding protein